MRARRLFALALILLAVNLSLQLPYLPERIASLASKLLSVAVIGLAGWAAIIAIDVASNLYVRSRHFTTEGDVLARKHLTQIRVLRRAVDVLIVLITVAAALMAFEPVRQFGVSLFASAGAAGLIVGLAARPVLSNMIAGIQLAITQPIRINDAVIVEGEWGLIEEITSTYVVIKIWDLRRLIVPLSYLMEKPFQNWTRDTTKLIGVVYLQADYAVPIADIRKKLDDIVAASPHWDKNVCSLEITDFTERTVEIRITASAANGGDAWNLRCEIREKLLAFLQNDHPESLPRQRMELSNSGNEYFDSSASSPRRAADQRGN
jgi:small-conductance mechanosensitive channel